MDSTWAIARLRVLDERHIHGLADIPGYALYPRGGVCSTTYFYRDLGP